MYLKVFECTWMYLNVFRVYLNVFECTYSIFMVMMYLNVIIIYSWYIFNVTIIYFNALIVCLNVFQCVWMYLSILYLEFYHHILIVTFLPCTPTYSFFFILHNDFLPNMLYHHIIIFPFPLIRSNFHTIYEKITYQSLLHVYTSPHIPHSTFHIVTSGVEHSGAQISFIYFGMLKTSFFNIFIKFNFY
jgi:hypothetical protein